MFNKLAALVGQAPSFPYTVGDPRAGGSWAGWTHHSGVARNDGDAAVSVWRISGRAGDPRLELARHGVRKLKTVKHPNILSFRDTAELEERGETVIYLVTEPATPLLPTLEELCSGRGRGSGSGGSGGNGMTSNQRTDFVAMGLHSIARAVSFLANDCGGLVHGNVCHSTVAVTPTLEWKLCCFDLLTEAAAFGSNLSPHMPPTQAPLPFGALPLLLNCNRGHYLPGEAQRGEWSTLATPSGGGSSPPWAVDAWGLGCLVAEAFTGKELPAAPGSLREAANALPQELVKDYQRLLASSPARRLNPSALADSEALRTPPVRALAFLDSLSVRDSAEKDAFFRGGSGGDGSGYISSTSSESLAAALPRFPPVVAQRRLLPALGAAVEFGGAPASAVPPLLSIANSFKDDDEFCTRAAPLIARLFRCSADRNVRRCLLEGVPLFGTRLPSNLVEAEIYPALTGTTTTTSSLASSGGSSASNVLGCGFTDPSPYIRELTLKSMLTLAPKLQARTLSQSLLKHLAKAQVDPEGGIRANTTILLGNLAPLLDAATVQRGVLLNAFSRALRDPFAPSRAAGAAALASTLSLHGPADVAAKALPALAPVCADAEGRARRAALQACDAVVAALKKNSAALDEKEREQEEEARRAKGGAGVGSGVGPTSNGNSYSSSSAPPPPPRRAAPDVLVVNAPRYEGNGRGSASGSSRRASSVDSWNDDGKDDDDGSFGVGGRKSGSGTGHVAPPLAADFGDDDDEWESMDAPAPPPPPRARPAAGAARPRGGSAAAAAAARVGSGGGLKLGRSGGASAPTAVSSSSTGAAASRFADLQL